MSQISIKKNDKILFNIPRGSYLYVAALAADVAKEWEDIEASQLQVMEGFLKHERDKLKCAADALTCSLYQRDNHAESIEALELIRDYNRDVENIKEMLVMLRLIEDMHRIALSQGNKCRLKWRDE